MASSANDISEMPMDDHKVCFSTYREHSQRLTPKTESWLCYFRTVYCPDPDRNVHPCRSGPIPLHLPSTTTELSPCDTRSSHPCNGWLSGSSLPPNVLLPLPLILLYQIHDGIYTEWPLMTANIPPVNDSAKHAWLALLIVSRASD